LSSCFPRRANGFSCGNPRSRRTRGRCAFGAPHSAGLVATRNIGNSWEFLKTRKIKDIRPPLPRLLGSSSSIHSSCAFGSPTSVFECGPGDLHSIEAWSDAHPRLRRSFLAGRVSRATWNDNEFPLAAITTKRSTDTQKNPYTDGPMDRWRLPAMSAVQCATMAFAGKRSIASRGGSGLLTFNHFLILHTSASLTKYFRSSRLCIAFDFVPR